MINSLWIDIEKYGSGFIRIRKEIKSYPSMTFSIEAAPNGLLTALCYEQQKITEELKVVEKVVEKVTENQLKILELIAENPAISASDISKNIGISHRKTQENIAKLKKLGLLKRIGPAKGGYWQVLKTGNE